jgi:hypothetical protein
MAGRTIKLAQVKNRNKNIQRHLRQRAYSMRPVAGHARKAAWNMRLGRSGVYDFEM